MPLVNALEAGDAQRVWRAVEKYQQEPDTAGLILEQLKGPAGRRRLCTIRASQELRVLLAREGPTSAAARSGRPRTPILNRQVALKTRSRRL